MGTACAHSRRRESANAHRAKQGSLGWNTSLGAAHIVVNKSLFKRFDVAARETHAQLVVLQVVE
eukprot:3478526-Pleurochrysis_carterae.AAC.2